MKRMRLAICVAVFALIGGIAFAEDMDIRALQAKLASQEARLNDLQAKMESSKGGDVTAKNITSIKKNAKVTIGGDLETRYYGTKGNIKSKRFDKDGASVGAADLGSRQKIADMKGGNLYIDTAKVAFKIDVNEYFDAYVRLDLHDAKDRGDVSGTAQYYWIRWKNLCNTGFGVLVGRDTMKFGGKQPMGVLDTWNKDSGGFNAGSGPFGNAEGKNHGDGMFAQDNLISARAYYNETRTTQITPYWENQDGTFKAELSFFEGADRMNGGNSKTSHDRDTYYKYRSINYGVGTMSTRIVWKPIEGLELMASAMNLHAKNGGDWVWGPNGRRGNLSLVDSQAVSPDLRTTSNSTAVNAAFIYRPCFFNRMQVWGSYTHGWNEYWIKDMDSDSVNAGVSFDLTDRLTWFGQGDYLRTKNKNSVDWYKATGWAAYTGLKYTLPYGVNLETGWRHEKMDYKGKEGGTHTKAKSDIIYGHVGFSF